MGAMGSRETETKTMPQNPKSSTTLADIPARLAGGKLGLLVTLMSRPEGADISDMMEATGWQQHSVRGALAGALKKHRGLNIVSEKSDGPRIYRVVEAEGSLPPAPASKAKKPGKPAKAAKRKSTKASPEPADA